MAKKKKKSSTIELHEKIDVLGQDLTKLKANHLGIYTKHLAYEVLYYSGFFLYLCLAFFLLIIWEHEGRSILIKAGFSFFTVLIGFGTYIVQQKLNSKIDEDYVIKLSKSEFKKKSKKKAS